MTDKSSNFVDCVDFAKQKTAGDVMRLFIEVANSYPDQANKLFDKYVAFVKSANPESTAEASRDLAARNISMMSGYYGARTSKLLRMTYDGLKQHKK